MIDLLLIFKPLKDRKALKAGIISGILIAVLYLIFSILIIMLSVGFTALPFIDLLIFSFLKFINMPILLIDWIILAMFPIAGGLLFANYSYWKCKDNTVGNLGLVGGLFAATCPACLLPILGLVSFTTLAFNIGLVVKTIALFLIIGSTYWIAHKQHKCNIGRK